MRAGIFGRFLGILASSYFLGVQSTGYGNSCLASWHCRALLVGCGDSVVILALLVSPDEGVAVRHSSFSGLIWWAEGMMTRLCVVWGSFGGMGRGGGYRHCGDRLVE